MATAHDNNNAEANNEHMVEGSNLNSNALLLSNSSSNSNSSTTSNSIQIVRPPAIMPPTPTSSPNTHEWPTFHFRERFTLPFLPPVRPVAQTENEFMPSFIHPSTLPSSSHNFKIRLRSRSKLRLSGDFRAQSHGRKLRIAASNCNIELLTGVLEMGADPNAADEYKRSPLHLAACRGYVSIVQELLKYGANPNVVDSLGNTPLHLAVISASSNNFNVVVRVLLQGGASVRMYDRSNQTPLDLAEAKLRMLRTRYNNPTPETAKILEDMCMLTTLILRYMVKQQKELDDLSALEKRLQNLSTSDKPDKDDVVSKAADELLASVERLSINK